VPAVTGMAQNRAILLVKTAVTGRLSQSLALFKASFPLPLRQSMKKIAAILFVTVYLLSTTEAHQLFKLPVIFEHYKEHMQENSQISFLEFLDLHYMHGSPRDKDYERDMQLPFKTQDDCLSISPAFVPLFVQHSVPAPELINTRPSFVLPQQVLLSSYLANIWQPPKNC
jgi:hypothetical protein